MQLVSGAVSLAMPAKLQAPGEYSGTQYTDSVQELSSSIISARDGSSVGVGLRKALLMALARSEGISCASRCTHFDSSEKQQR